MLLLLPLLGVIATTERVLLLSSLVVIVTTVRVPQLLPVVPAHAHVLARMPAPAHTAVGRRNSLTEPVARNRQVWPRRELIIVGFVSIAAG